MLGPEGQGTSANAATPGKGEGREGVIIGLVVAVGMVIGVGIVL